MGETIEDGSIEVLCVINESESSGWLKYEIKQDKTFLAAFFPEYDVSYINFINSILYIYMRSNLDVKLPNKFFKAKFFLKSCQLFLHLYVRVFYKLSFYLLSDSSKNRCEINRGIFRRKNNDNFWIPYMTYTFFGLYEALPWWRSAWGPWWHSSRPWYQDATPPCNPAQSRVLWLRRSRLHDGLTRDVRSVGKGYWSP